ncbi:MAG: ABC transporter permease [Desulfobacteraceae bacterium]|nr:ABC transporter permease [Desulfobacteraceae bacterium]
MVGYFIRRLFFSLLALLGVIIFIFLLTRMLGDPAALILGADATNEEIAMLNQEWGLDQPLPMQLYRFLINFAQGNWGQSFRHGRPVLDMIMERLPATLQLTLTAQCLALFLAVPLGAIAALKRKSAYDRGVMVAAMLGQSIPMFWLGLMMIILFGVKLEWLPVSGKGTFLNIIMPAIALSTVPLSIMTRLQRSSLLEVLQMDYMVTAESKGLSDMRVIFKHGLRNAFIPVLTVFGIQIGRTIGGAVIVETVFAWPGMGLLIIHAVHNLDFPVIQGGVIMIAMAFILVSLIVDLSYAFVDPRVRKE